MGSWPRTDSNTHQSKLFTNLKPRIDLYLWNMVKTTEVTFLSYIWKIEVIEEETNWLLETTGFIKLMDDKGGEVLISFYFTCQAEGENNDEFKKTKAQDRWKYYKRELCCDKWDRVFWLQQIPSQGPKSTRRWGCHSSVRNLGGTAVKGRCDQRLETGNSGSLFNKGNSGFCKLTRRDLISLWRKILE